MPHTYLLCMAWCRITSSITKLMNFLANAGSRSASLASCSNLSIWLFSRTGSEGGRLNTHRFKASYCLSLLESFSERVDQDCIEPVDRFAVAL